MDTTTSECGSNHKPLCLRMCAVLYVPCLCMWMRTATARVQARATTKTINTGNDESIDVTK
eukprot:8023134-Alexandrium_andersonii.AAC.1